MSSIAKVSDRLLDSLGSAAMGHGLSRKREATRCFSGGLSSPALPWGLKDGFGHVLLVVGARGGRAVGKPVERGIL